MSIASAIEIAQVLGIARLGSNSCVIPRSIAGFGTLLAYCGRQRTLHSCSSRSVQQFQLSREAICRTGSTSRPKGAGPKQAAGGHRQQYRQRRHGRLQARPGRHAVALCRGDRAGRGRGGDRDDQRRAACTHGQRRRAISRDGDGFLPGTARERPEIPPTRPSRAMVFSSSKRVRNGCSRGPAIFASRPTATW